MSVPIELHVVGIPQTQGSKSAVLIGGEARLLEGKTAEQRERLRSWRTAVAEACRRYLADHPQAPIAEPCSLEVEFRFAPSKSQPDRWHHASQPDLSKVVRSTEDALVHGGLLADDRYISLYENVGKRYARADEPVGARIVVRPLGGEEQTIQGERKAARRHARRTAAA